MIAKNQMNLSIQSIQYICPFQRTTQTEISQMEHCISWRNNSVPIFNKHFIHLVNILEWTVTESNDVCVIEVGIRCKECMFCIIFIVHSCSPFCVLLRFNIEGLFQSKQIYPIPLKFIFSSVSQFHSNHIP